MKVLNYLSLIAIALSFSVNAFTNDLEFTKNLETLNKLNPEFSQKLAYGCSENDVSFEDIIELLCDDIDPCDEEFEEFANFYFCFNLVDTASKFEKTKQNEITKLLYEEAGNQCIQLYEEDTAYGHLSSSLLAGLCYEKNPLTLQKAKDAYELLISDYKKFISQNVEDMSSGDESLDSFYAYFFTAPVYLEVSLASLKCGYQDIFVGIVCRQIDEVASICESHEGKAFINYIEAFANIAEIVLGQDHPGIAKIKESRKKLSRHLIKLEKPKYSLRRKEIESTLLSILAASKETTVEEMVKLLESGHLISP